MSEKDNTNFNSSEKDEFLKRNVPLKKICPLCKREYSDENILFCYYDGNRLVLTNEPGETITPNIQKTSYLFNEFSGFELNLQNSSHNLQIPLELIHSTTRLIQTNPKMPLDSENVKTWFWAIPFPKKKRNFISKLFSHVGFSSVNLFSYLMCYILILATYILWVTETNSKIFNFTAIYNPQIIGLALAATIFTLIVLILPIISLGYTETEILQATKNEFYLKIEPVIFIITLLMNYIIFRIGWPIPILIIPGEPIIKSPVPTEHVVTSLKRSIYPSVVMVLVAFVLGLGMKYLKYGSTLVQMNIELMALFGLTILLFELLPYRNFIGKILLKKKPLTFYVSFSLVIFSLMVILSLTQL